MTISLDEIHEKLQKRDGEFEYMGEGVKAQDNIETPVSNWDEDEWGATEEEVECSASDILQKIKDRKQRQFGADLYSDITKEYVEQQMGLNVLATPEEPIQFTRAEPNNNIVISNNNIEMVSINVKTGQVTFSEEYDFDETAESFWTCMGQKSPTLLQREIEELKAEIECESQPKMSYNERMYHEVREQIHEIASSFIFEPNDPQTRCAMTHALDTYLSLKQAKREISQYWITCNEENNPPSVIQRNELFAMVILQPQSQGDKFELPIHIKAEKTPLFSEIKKMADELCESDVEREMKEVLAVDISAMDIEIIGEMLEKHAADNSYDDAMKVL